MAYKRLKLKDRILLASLKAEGYKNNKIAQRLGCHPSSISRELKTRPSIPFYHPYTAQQRAEHFAQQSHKRPLLLNHPELKKHVFQGLQKKWSPEIISGRMKQQKTTSISYETIYKFIYEQHPAWTHKLPRAHPQRYPRYASKYLKRSISGRVSISQRPHSANKRMQIGHWETDLLCGKGKASLQVLVDRKSRLTKLTPLINKKAVFAYRALRAAFKKMTQHNHKTITYDNGYENSLHEKINYLFKTRSYFCDPYAAYQKGMVENIMPLGIIPVCRKGPMASFDGSCLRAPI